MSSPPFPFSIHAHLQTASAPTCCWCWSRVSWLRNFLEASFSSKLFTYSPLAALQCRDGACGLSRKEGSVLQQPVMTVYLCVRVIEGTVMWCLHYVHLESAVNTVYVSNVQHLSSDGYGALMCSFGLGFSLHIWLEIWHCLPNRKVINTLPTRGLRHIFVPSLTKKKKYFSHDQILTLRHIALFITILNVGV